MATTRIYTYGPISQALHQPSRSTTHKGTTRLAPPTAKPTILRPAIIPHTLVVKACHTAPTTNSASATRMTFFRPSLSAKTLATGLARSAKRLVELVIKLLSSVFRGRRERSEPMDTSVEEITPVLHNAQNSENRSLQNGDGVGLGRGGFTHNQTIAHLFRRRRSEPR